MDYQFTRSIRGKVQAEFEHELMLLGMWFTEELASDLKSLRTLLDKVSDLESGHIHEWKINGKDINLVMDKDEVTVFRTATSSHNVEYLPEGTEIDSLSESAGCGLEDFKQVLHSWQDFIQS